MHGIDTCVFQKAIGDIELAISNEELASAAAITFDASRSMSDWRRFGALAKNRGVEVAFSQRRLFSLISRSRFPPAGLLRP